MLLVYSNVTRAIYAHALTVFPGKKSIWLRAAALPQGSMAALSGEPRAHLLYRRGPKGGKTVTLAGLRRLLARAGYD